MSIKKISTDQLLRLFNRHAERLTYSNLKTSKEYGGWTSDFGITFQDDGKIALNLDKSPKQSNDRFLLFVLAVAWSRTGQWENAAYFVSYLIKKGNPWNTPEYWKVAKNRAIELNSKKINAQETQEAAKMKSKKFDSVERKAPRKNIAFREDIFESIGVLAEHWGKIESRLQQLRGEKDPETWKTFMGYIREIEGLGVGKNRIYMKIPLILRELRCQGWTEIPGEFCCVVDARVLDACADIDIDLSRHGNTIDHLISNSSKVYEKFRNLYDIPLFAYEDMK